MPGSPEVTVSGSAGRWTAEAGGVPVGDLLAATRPNGLCYLMLPDRPDALAPLLAAALAELGRQPVHAFVDAGDAAAMAALAAAGFATLRSEGGYVVPVRAPARPVAADGCDLVSAADSDLDRLRALDEAVREDIPGGAGWRWTPEAFHHETFGDPAFDPRTYLVAVDRRDGRYAGLVRVWMNRSGPRLGCLAVLPAYRRTRVTAALIGAVMSELADRGHRELVTEVDDGNRAALALLARIGARRTETSLELRRPATS